MKKIILTAAIAICATFGVNAQNIYGTSSKRSSTSSLSIGTTNGSVRYQQGYENHQHRRSRLEARTGPVHYWRGSYPLEETS